MQPEYVRRNPNGSIDYDFYRRRAARLRAQRLGHFVRRTAAAIRPLVAIVLLIGAVLAVPTHAPEVAAAAIRATDTIAALAVDHAQR